VRSVSTLIRMSATAAPSTRRALTLALALCLLWVLVTYLLEGRILTLQRPEATGARLAHALVANILIGIGGSVLVVRFLSNSSEILARQAGFRGPQHAAVACRGRCGTWLRHLRCTGCSLLKPRSRPQHLRSGARGIGGRGAGVLGGGRERRGVSPAGSREVGVCDLGGDHRQRFIRRLPLCS
jgi:hypothetical protein